MGIPVSKIIIPLIALCVSSFSLGFSLAMYGISECRIRMAVQKRLKKAMKQHCAVCQCKTDQTVENTESTKAAIDR